MGFSRQIFLIEMLDISKVCLSKICFNQILNHQKCVNVFSGHSPVTDETANVLTLFVSKLEIYVSNSMSVQFVMPLWLQKSEILISQNLIERFQTNQVLNKKG